jgi:hypothetical protein
MRYLEKRIAVLESRDMNPAWFVWRNSGETIDEAVARVGGGLGYVVTVIGWLDQAEAVHRKEMTLCHYFDTDRRE